ncbi:hypothetical protein Y1Q_0008343 [Alligator mississippiensis]|uniref:Uncharacterized protein n=1 Tax=Alligator mississippiensis TaxID=8496 RepID=A0A151N1Q3_ALLMI|nr:hypothetical protein Y1Q_0008343 [Alligator mississippiensis]
MVLSRCPRLTRFLSLMKDLGPSNCIADPPDTPRKQQHREARGDAEKKSCLHKREDEMHVKVSLEQHNNSSSFFASSHIWPDADGLSRHDSK